MIELDDVIALERESEWLEGLTPAARAAYGELLEARGEDGYVSSESARAAVRAAIEPDFARIAERPVTPVHGRCINSVSRAIREAGAGAALGEQIELARGVLVELDERGLVRVEPTRWRVWTQDEAEEAQEVFGL